jgi:hypothetical protein
MKTNALHNVFLNFRENPSKKKVWQLKLQPPTGTSLSKYQNKNVNKANPENSNFKIRHFLPRFC